MQTLPVNLSRSSSDKVVFQCAQWRSLFRPWRGSCRVLLGRHRHGGDSDYAELLMRVRVGAQTDNDIALINSTWSSFSDEQRLLMPQLRSLRASAAQYNSERLSELPGEAVSFFAADVVTSGTLAEKQSAVEQINQHADALITLKVQAPVVALRRLSPNVPTGSVGRVVEFPASNEVVCLFKGVAVVVKTAKWDVFNDRGVVIGHRTQVPLLLAWALTIHRAQGSELDGVCIDFSRDDWACDGLVYTALSRVRFLRSLCVRGLTMAIIKTSATCLAFWTALVEATESSL